ncbi:MAG: MoaD/ThiS family protein [Desulfurococcaceae archaeon]|nr:MoaD/ThiS family protein [Desulfurococcaceae archaeon]
MVLRVKILETNQLVELDVERITVRELLSKLGLTVSEHIVLKNGEVVTEDDVIEGNSEVVVFTVKSGG